MPNSGGFTTWASIDAVHQSKCHTESDPEGSRTRSRCVLFDTEWVSEATIVEQILREEVKRQVTCQRQTRVDIQEANDARFAVVPWPNAPVPVGRTAMLVIVQAGEAGSG